MQLGTGMNLRSFCFLTRGRSEIGIFGPLPTRLHPRWGSDVDEQPQPSESNPNFASQERWIVSFGCLRTGSHRRA